LLSDTLTGSVSSLIEDFDLVLLTLLFILLDDLFKTSLLGCFSADLFDLFDLSDLFDLFDLFDLLDLLDLLDLGDDLQE